MVGLKASIIVPVHNESLIVEGNAEQISKYVEKLSVLDEFEVLLCDNGSNDDTLEKIKHISKSIVTINSVSVKEKGVGHGLRAGIKEAKNEILIFYPIDLSFNLSFIPESVEKLSGGSFDIVVGSKGLKQSTVTRNSERQFFSGVFNFLVNFLLGLDIKDTQGTLTFKRSQVLGFVDEIKSNDLFFSVELLIYARGENLKILEIPVKVEDTRKTSKISPVKDGFHAFLRLMKAAWKIRF
ncbi:MAG: glycosyltransferase family 2 protein [Candidatus Hodarchaeales archaeon]